MVVMSGAAALAGSIFSFFAINGSTPPARLADISEIAIVRLTTKLIVKVVLLDPKIYNLIKLEINNINPQSSPTANSFLKTINKIEEKFSGNGRVLILPLLNFERQHFQQ